MTSFMIEVAAGLSDVDQQVDHKGPLVFLWPFEWLLRFHQHINWELGLVIIFI